MRYVLTVRAACLTVATTVYFFLGGSHAIIEPMGGDQLNTTAPDPAAQTELVYEWVVNEVVYQYAQESSFSLLTFNVPPRTEKAEFQIFLFDKSKDRKKRDIFLSVRRAAIPVIQAYNETAPDSFVLPDDQQTYRVSSQDVLMVTLNLNSPTPGRVYILASVLNPFEDVIQYLRWGEKLSGDCSMNVKAMYTKRTAMTSLAINDVNTIDVSARKPQTFSFTVPAVTTAYSLIISNCSGPGNGSNCPVNVTTSESLSLDDPSSVRVDCRKSGEGQRCELNVTSPKIENEHFVTFSTNDVGNVTFDVSFEFEGCPSPVAASHTYMEGGEKTVVLMHYKNATGYDAVHNDVVSNPACLNFGPLSRVSIPPDDFNFRAIFGSATMEGNINPNFDLIASDQLTAVRTFNIKESVDSGGSLHISAFLMDEDWKGTIWVCTMAHRVARNGTLEQCPNGVLMTVNATEGRNPSGDKGEAHDEVFIPFPLSGTWYIAVQSQCWGSSGPKPCDALPMVEVSVKMAQCAEDQCGKFGKCQQYIEGTTLYSSCECYAGYRGLSCNDVSYALTESEQLRAVYLLTLSNLAFLPAIFLALHRHFFELAAVFTFNFIFSTFYHACDANHVYQLCITEYKTLSFGDFFGSILSFYALLTTMARIPETLRSTLLMCGTLIIAAVLTKDVHNNVAHIVPLVVIGFILVVSWVYEMRVRRKLFPSKRRYLFFLLPGAVLALLGIGINYGLMYHLSTYQFTHSFWHLCLMICPCFLMPPRKKALPGKTKGLSISAQDIIRTGQQLHSPGEPHHQESNEEAQLLDASVINATSDRNPLI